MLNKIPKGGGMYVSLLPCLRECNIPIAAYTLFMSAFISDCIPNAFVGTCLLFAIVFIAHQSKRKGWLKETLRHFHEPNQKKPIKERVLLCTNFIKKTIELVKKRKEKCWKLNKLKAKKHKKKEKLSYEYFSFL